MKSFDQGNMNRQPRQIVVQIIPMERGKINRVLIRQQEDLQRGNGKPDRKHEHRTAGE